MPTLEEFSFYPDSSPSFLQDVYLGNLKPKTRTGEEKTEGKGTTVRLTLLEMEKKVRQYGQHNNASASTVYHFVVYDGTTGLFKVVLDSGKSHDVPERDLIPGCTLIIQHDAYRFILKQDDPDGTKRGVMFVSNFDYDPSPGQWKENRAADDSSEVTPDFCSTFIDKDAIDLVMKDNVMLFLKSFQHEDGFFYFVRMTPERVLTGEFIACASLKKSWKESQKKRGRDEPCSCLESPFFFERCITVAFPLNEVNESELYDSVSSKLKGKLSGKIFEDTRPSHKRWSYYWFYAVNFLHFGGGERQELPTCLVESIRQKYPDPTGSYTGFCGN